MRQLLTAAAALVFLLLWVMPATAEPTILGPTGLIVNPTADITPVDHAWIALNFFDNGSNSIWTTNVTGSMSDNFEVNIGAVHPDEGRDGITVGLKCLFMPESENAPGAAAGITFTDIAGDNVTSYYVVASKFFYLGDNASENASIHGGVTYVDSDGGDDFDFYVGLDVELVEKLIAILEYSGENTPYFDGFTYGARYYVGTQFTAQAAFIDGDLHIGGSFIF